MSEAGLSGRFLKKRVKEILSSKSVNGAMEELSVFPARKVINPLFSLLFSSDQDIKWKAVTLVGLLVDKLASKEMESARVIVRRLMWNLNDESGGIGWGSAEAMGEILARNGRLAGEFSSILISYIREDGNFQELESMQRGVLWGIGRLAQVKPEFIKESAHFIIPFMTSDDPTVRGTAAWIMGLLGNKQAYSGLRKLSEDGTEIQIYLDQKLARRRVKDIAKEALSVVEN